MTSTIFLARHGHHAEVGQVLSGRSDIALDPAGQAQAQQLTRRLQDVPLQAIYTSPRQRCRQTATVIAQGHDLPVQVLEELDEIDFGYWAGQPFAALAGDSAWQQWNRARGTAATPAGATMAGVIGRALAAVSAVAAAGCTLFVTHCDIIRGIVAQVLGLDADRLLAFDLDCASLTTLTLADGCYRLVGLNEGPR